FCYRSELIYNCMPSLQLTFALHYKPQWVYAFVISFSLIVASACGQADGQNYFPLADGAKWEYTGRYSSADGRQFAVRGEIRVDGETLIHGQRYFKYVITTDLSSVLGTPKTQEDVRYYRAAPDGIYFLTGRNTDAPERLEL